jgi:hypothetical protein
MAGPVVHAHAQGRESGAWTRGWNRPVGVVGDSVGAVGGGVVGTGVVGAGVVGVSVGTGVVGVSVGIGV